MLSACLAALDDFVRRDGPMTPRTRALMTTLEDELQLKLVRDDGSPSEQAVALARAGRTALVALDGFFARAERLACPQSTADVLPLRRLGE